MVENLTKLNILNIKEAYPDISNLQPQQKAPNSEIHTKMSPLIPNDENKPNTQIPVVLSTPSIFVQTPLLFFKPSISPPAVVVDVLHNFHKSISSSALNFLNFLHFSASQNPLLGKFLSFSSHLQNFSQVHLKSYRSLNSVSCHNFAAVLPGDSVAGIVVANGILNFLNLYNTVLVVRLVLTWFPSAPQQIVSPLSTLCDPYLNIFRGIIPPLGGTLDLSPILAFLVLNAFTSAATALPAELPPGLANSVTGHQGSSQPGCLSDLTFSQKKWQRRLQGKRLSNSECPK